MRRNADPRAPDLAAPTSDSQATMAEPTPTTPEALSSTADTKNVKVDVVETAPIKQSMPTISKLAHVLAIAAALLVVEQRDVKLAAKGAQRIHLLYRRLRSHRDLVQLLVGYHEAPPAF